MESGIISGFQPECWTYLPTRGEEIKIYTYLYVKEDAFSLFGFPSRDELEMFKLLINVSGIGPKGGLAVLSVLSANDLRYAIVAEDVKTISKAPGGWKQDGKTADHRAEG